MKDERWVDQLIDSIDRTSNHEWIYRNNLLIISIEKKMRVHNYS
ncbi:MAG: hypothetical protein ACTSRZ_16205 [Promethearchaeota archaeon]